MKSMNYPVIDPHVHVWKNDPRYPWAKETVHPPAQDALPETLLELMKANGVSKTLLVQVIHYRWDNSYTAAVLRQYPEYFRAVGRVNPQDPEAPDHVSALVEQGFTGVRISPAADAAGDWIRGPLMDPLWRRCRDEKASLSVLAPIAHIQDVTALIDRFPDLDVIIDHMADCPPESTDRLRDLLALNRYPNVFVKVSHTWSLSRQPFPYEDSQAMVKRVYDAFGPRKLMWGTDWPLVDGYCGYAGALAMVRDHMDFLNEDDRRWMLSGTPQRVFGF